MYNEEVTNLLIGNYGRESAKIYCKMEVSKNNALLKELKESGVKREYYSEYEYEATWWENKYQELLNNNDYENDRNTGPTS